MDGDSNLTGLACNVELKARLLSASQAHEVARAWATAPVEQQFQRDTYFCCPRGRLKIRQIDDQRGQLIWYQRADEAAARESYYRLTEIAEATLLLDALGEALGVSGKVVKQRTIYWYENVRIHVDEVESLGSFLEFEAVIASDRDRREAGDKLERLLAAFEVGANDLLTESYGDMVEAEES